MSKDIYEHAQSLKLLPKDQICIEVSHLCKDYGKGKGLFDVSFVVPKGKTFGYCGTNGAGKTTTLRHIMGFLRPDSGTVTVNGLDAWKDAPEIKKYIGYLPGEIAFPPFEDGSAFLKSQAEMLGVSDMSRAEQIINALQLDPTANLKRMSKGMKQKTALVAAFMHRPSIILLDEPTTGLDPLMRESFINIIKEEKARGATIIMSNHMFDELEETCDYVAFIKDGHIVDIVDMEEIHNRPFHEYLITFNKQKDFHKFDVSSFEVLEKNENNLYYILKVKNKDLNNLFSELQKYEIKLIKEIQYTLEKYFMKYVIGELQDEKE